MKPIRVVFEQNGKQTTLFSLERAGQGADRAGRHRQGAYHAGDRQGHAFPDLQAGAAKIIVTAGRP